MRGSARVRISDGRRGCATDGGEVEVEVEGDETWGMGTKISELKRAQDTGAQRRAGLRYVLGHWPAAAPSGPNGNRRQREKGKEGRNPCPCTLHPVSCIPPSNIGRKGVKMEKRLGNIQAWVAGGVIWQSLTWMGSKGIAVALTTCCPVCQFMATEGAPARGWWEPHRAHPRNPACASARLQVVRTPEHVGRANRPPHLPAFRFPHPTLISFWEGAGQSQTRHSSPGQEWCGIFVIGFGLLFSSFPSSPPKSPS